MQTTGSLLLAFSLSLPMAAGCAVEPPTKAVATARSNLMAHACNVAGLSPSEVAECIRWVYEQTHDPAYCDEYQCVEFSNSYCEGAENYDIACAGLAVACGDTGHAVNVVFFPGAGCYIVEPQNGSVVAGPYAAVDGSCNTFSPDVADRVCTSVGAEPAECTWYTRDDIVQGWPEGCHDLE